MPDATPNFTLYLAVPAPGPDWPVLTGPQTEETLVDAYKALQAISCAEFILLSLPDRTGETAYFKVYLDGAISYAGSADEPFRDYAFIWKE